MKCGEIESIYYSLYSPEEIHRLSVCHVTEASTYVRNFPRANGLNDLRLGTIDRQYLCSTCKNDMLICCGHIGHIDLAFPMFHSSYVPFIIKVLRCVCFMCFRLKIHEGAVEQLLCTTSMTDCALLTALSKLLATKLICSHCSAPQPTYRRGGSGIAHSFKEGTKFQSEEEKAFCEAPLTALSVRDMLCAISDETAETIGLSPATSRPENMVLQTIVVPPPIIRPNFTTSESCRTRGQDDITTKLHEIVRANRSLKDALNAVIRANTQLLFHQEDLTESTDASEDASKQYKQKEAEVCRIIGVSEVSALSQLSTDSCSVKICTSQHMWTGSSIHEDVRKDVLSYTLNYGGITPFITLPAVKNLIDQLQLHVTEYVHREASAGAVGAVGGRKGGSHSRKLKLIFDRFRGKRGRLRGSLQGKRVNYSARSVISPDPIMDMDLIGVPFEIARELTTPVRVTPFNIDELSACVRRGPLHQYGANGISFDDGSTLDLTLVEDLSDVELQIGWTVERHMLNGDWVIFNRQPSLHRMSMMGHRVKLIPGKSFRLSLCNTSPYNADFDGDEMNLHSMRSLPATAEVQEIMSVKNQIISPQANRPVIGLIMDSIAGAFLMTQQDVFFTREEACQLAMSINYLPRGYSQSDKSFLPPPAVFKPIALWTGKQIFSLLFPKELYLNRGSMDTTSIMACGKDKAVLIERGQLLHGVLCKKTLGASELGIIHVIQNDFTPNDTVKFISDAQRLLVAYLQCRAFSIGLSDCVLDEYAEQRLKIFSKNVKEHSEKIHSGVRSGVLKAEDVLGAEIEIYQGLLGKVLPSVAPNYKKLNSLVVMCDSGSKGSQLNMTQISCFVGQQSVEGGRIEPDSEGRTLVAFAPYEKDMARTRGFVENSYFKGVNAEEYFFHSMGGREGLVHTAVKTAATGYIQRRIMKVLESHTVAYDRTVRDSRKHVIQFTYGSDGFEASRVERVTLPCIGLCKDKLISSFQTPLKELNKRLYALFWIHEGTSRHEKFQELQNRALNELLTALSIVSHGRSIGTTTVDRTLFLPINIDRIFKRATDPSFYVESSPTDSTGKFLSCIDPIEAVESVLKMVTDLRLELGETCSYGLQAYLLHGLSVNSIYLNPLKLTSKAQPLSMAGFRWVLSTIMKKCVRALAEPGEMVGAVAASCIGQPTTQMTLNTFHYSGVAEKNVTLGVPRLTELIDVVANIKTPSLTIFYPPNCSQDYAQRVSNNMRCLLFGAIVESMNVVTDTESYYSKPEMEDELMAMQWAAILLKKPARYVTTSFSATSMLPENTNNPFGKSAVLRYVLRKDAILAAGLSCVQVTRSLRLFLLNKAYVFGAEEGMSNWFIGVVLRSCAARVKSGEEAAESDSKVEALLMQLHSQVSDVLISGNAKIAKTFTQQETTVRLNEVTGGLEEVREWTSSTQGSNLQDVLKLPGVDWRRIVSNDIHEVCEVLGLEAACAVLRKEMTEVLSFDGTYVSECHIKLLVDTVTHEGGLTPMTRHGIKRSGGSVLRCASFEETMAVFFNAAGHGLQERLQGVSEAIVVGQKPLMGTASFGLISTSDYSAPPCVDIEVEESKAVVQTVAPMDIGELSDSISDVMSDIQYESEESDKEITIRPHKKRRVKPFYPSSPVYTIAPFSPGCP